MVMAKQKIVIGIMAVFLMIGAAKSVVLDNAMLAPMMALGQGEEDVIINEILLLDPKSILQSWFIPFDVQFEEYRDPDFILKKWHRLIDLLRMSEFNVIGWHNTRISFLPSIIGVGIKGDARGDVHFQIFNFSDEKHIRENSAIMTALANSILMSEDTYGRVQGTEDHGVIIFPLNSTSVARWYERPGMTITKAVPEEIVMNPVEGIDSRYLRPLELIVRNSELSEVIRAYFNKYGERPHLTDAIATLYLKARWLDKLIHFAETQVKGKSHRLIEESI